MVKQIVACGIISFLFAVVICYAVGYPLLFDARAKDCGYMVFNSDVNQMIYKKEWRHNLKWLRDGTTKRYGEGIWYHASSVHGKATIPTAPGNEIE